MVPGSGRVVPSLGHWVSFSRSFLHIIPRLRMHGSYDEHLLDPQTALVFHHVEPFDG